MHKSILSASVSVQEKEQAQELQFDSGINILCSRNAEDVVLTLAGVLGGMPPKNGKVEIQWNADASLFIPVKDGACGVERAGTQCMNIAQLVKEFHKYHFLNFRNCAHILDGADIPAGFSGASTLLQKKLRDTLAKEDDRPLFVYNFLERLDEAVDLQHIFEALNATGRQVFIAVPHYYEIKTLEEMPYDTAIHTL
jgi:hypothetical protein